MASAIQETCASITLSDIYDTYVEEAKKKKKEKEEKGQKASSQEYQPKEDISVENTKALIFMERALNQNIFDEVNYDFRYYEDPADEFRSDGSLLPLWRFFLPGQNIPVTGIEWNKTFPDNLAVAFGDCENFI